MSGPEPRLLVLPVVHLHVAAATARPHQEALLPAYGTTSILKGLSLGLLMTYKWIDLGLKSVAPGFIFFDMSLINTFLPVNASLRWVNNG